MAALTATSTSTACWTKPPPNSARRRAARRAPGDHEATGRRAGQARTTRAMKLASRLDHIEPFYVMEFAKAAVELARSPACDIRQGGEPMIFLNIGEPDFTAPGLVREASDRA